MEIPLLCHITVVLSGTLDTFISKPGILVTFQEYKDAILRHLEEADDCEAVEQIIQESVERMRIRNFNATQINYYLEELYEGLKKLRPMDFDPVHWVNIRYATLYLYKII